MLEAQIKCGISSSYARNVLVPCNSSRPLDFEILGPLNKAISYVEGWSQGSLGPEELFIFFSLYKLMLYNLI